MWLLCLHPCQLPRTPLSVSCWRWASVSQRDSPLEASHRACQRRVICQTGHLPLSGASLVAQWQRRQSQHRRCRRCWLDPWVGQIPWRRAWQPTPVLLPGKPHGQGAWPAEVHRVSERQTRLRRRSAHTPLLGLGSWGWKRKWVSSPASLKLITLGSSVVTYVNPIKSVRVEYCLYEKIYTYSHF